MEVQKQWSGTGVHTGQGDEPACPGKILRHTETMQQAGSGSGGKGGRIVTVGSANRKEKPCRGAGNGHQGKGERQISIRRTNARY